MAGQSRDLLELRMLNLEFEKEWDDFMEQEWNPVIQAHKL